MALASQVFPTQVRGPIDSVLNSHSNWRFWYPWLENLRGTNTFVHLSAAWVDKNWPPDPDPNFDHYVLSGDSGMPGWAEHVARLHDRPVYMISLPEVYDDPPNGQVIYVPNTYYHKQISMLSELIDLPTCKDIRYKASALTNRLTQSKVIIFSSLYQQLGADCIVSLSDQIELNNVHYWAATNNKILDDLTDYFKNNWLSKTINIPGDNKDPLSVDNPTYTQSALNFTQESYHYSLMYDATKQQNSIHSGPFLTEKTFKCLLSQTAFIPVGQFRSYRWLETMGMQFEYGLDLNFDDDAGNITRLHSVVDLIQQLSMYTAQDLFEMTRASTLHNYSLITSREFWDRCENRNQSALIRLYDQVLG